MQSGGKMQLRPSKQRGNPRNSFAPSENSFNNEFLTHDEQPLDQSQAASLPNGSRIKEETPRLDRSRHSPSNDSGPVPRNDKNGQRLHQKMEVIHEESLNLNANNDPKPRPKKNSSLLQDEQTQEKQPSPKRFPPNNPNEINQNQSQELLPVPEEKKMKDLNAGMEKLSESLLELRENYHQFEKQQQRHKQQGLSPSRSKQKLKSSIFGEKPVQEIEKEYKEFLKVQHKEKDARKRVLEQIAEKDRKRLDQERLERQKMKEEEKRQRIGEIKAHNKFSDKHKRSKDLQAERKKAIEQFMKKYGGKQSFAKRKEKEDQEKQLQLLGQQKQYLSERKEMFKPINFEEIDQHEKWYLDKVEELINEKRDLKEEELKKIEEENAEFPEFYKGKAHQIALEQRLEKVRRKKQPIEKIKRIENYQKYVRENFVPRTFENKSMESSQLRNDSSLTHREVKRYRYFKGVPYGQVMESRPIAKSSDEIRQMGLHNFEFMKKLPKKREKVDAYELKLLEQSQNLNHRIKREDHFIKEEKKAKTRVALPESVKSDELIMIMKQLKSNDQLLKHKQYALNSQPQIFNEVSGQRKINEQMVDSIERKLSLLAQL